MDKSKPKQDSERLDKLAQELEQLEQLAGIAQAMKLVRAGRNLPPATLGGHATPQEYVADDYDRRRSATRGVYYSVADAQHRRQLIALSRKTDSYHRQSTDEQIEISLREVALAQENANQQPWAKAGLLGIALVAFGFWASQLAGAIAGVIAASFLGLGLVINARNNARLRLIRATRKLEQAKKEHNTYALFPELFSAVEEASGKRHADFDLEFAYRNTLGKQEK